MSDSVLSHSGARTVAVTPVIGEFGYVVFDIQPKVRWWLRQQKAARKVVFAPRSLAPLFEEATEIIELPAEFLPSAPATMRSIVYEHWQSGDPERVKIEQLVGWARERVQADEWLDIPYFSGQAWDCPASPVLLRGNPEVEYDEPYCVIAARARAFDAWRNWPTRHWDELVSRIRSEWKLQVRMIGQPPSTYFPPGAIAQEVPDHERLNDSINLLSHAVCSISSNSGPTHLSLMAGCPTFAWGEPYLKGFMERYTNPLGTWCDFLTGGWDPPVDAVWDHLERGRQRLSSEGMWRPERCRKRLRVSMCMIARNSSRTIEAALRSVSPWVDEMVVVDTGSDDDTPRIANECGAKVFQHPWQDSFSIARNESFRHALGEWLFWMDSDDTISEANGERLRQLVTSSIAPAVMGHVLQVQCPAGSSEGAYATPTVVDHIKLVRNLPVIRFTGRIHEQVLPAIRRLGGDVEWTNIFVTHSGSDHSAAGRVRKYERDLRLLQIELSEEPDSTFALFNLGMTLADMGRPEEALNPLARSLQMAESGDSHLRKVYGLLTQCYTQLQRLESAWKTCNQGLRVCSDDNELLFRRGTLATGLGYLEIAEASFLALLTRSPSRHFSSVDIGILGLKAWHNLAIVYERRQETGRAIEAWRKVLDLDAANDDAWWALVELLTVEKAWDELAKIGAEQNVPRHLVDLKHVAAARVRAARGQYREALSDLSRQYEFGRSRTVLQELCRIAFESRLLDAAERWLTEFTGQYPDDASAWQNLGAVLFQRHNYQRAIASVDASLRLRPGHQAALDLRSRCIAVAMCS